MSDLFAQYVNYLTSNDPRLLGMKTLKQQDFCTRSKVVAMLPMMELQTPRRSYKDPCTIPPMQAPVG